MSKKENKPERGNAPKGSKPQKPAPKKRLAKSPSPLEFCVLKDTREQLGWNFPLMKLVALETGDYSIEGMENIFTIERKGSVSEVATNITEERFADCIERLSKMPFAFLVLEFSISDVLAFPKSIPSSKRHMVKINGRFILKKLMEYAVDKNIKVMFAGSKGDELARSILKRMFEWREKNPNLTVSPK